MTLAEALTGPSQAAADAIAAKLDLERWKRDGWPTVAEDLGAAAASAVLRWAGVYLTATGHEQAGDDLSTIASKVDPTRTVG